MDKLRETVTDLYMSGRQSAGTIARTIAGENPPSDLVDAIGAILEDPAFHKEIEKLQSDVVASGFERCRKNVHEALAHLEACMRQSDDMRTRLAASKLLLELGGLATVQKHEIFTPRMYQEQLRPLLKKEYRALDARAPEDDTEGDSE